VTHCKLNSRASSIISVQGILGRDQVCAAHPSLMKLGSLGRSLGPCRGGRRSHAKRSDAEACWSSRAPHVR
jgi:hypothetical protein